MRIKKIHIRLFYYSRLLLQDRPIAYFRQISFESVALRELRVKFEKPFGELIESAEIEKKLRTEEIQTERQKKQYADLLQEMEKARTARHDLRHILLVLDSYAEIGDMEAFRSYLRQILQDRE